MKLDSLQPSIIEAEYNLIVQALEKTNFNKSKAAKLLGVDRKTVYNKIQRYKAFLAEKQRVA